MELHRQRLDGVTAAMITPLTPGGDLDEAGVRSLVEYLVRASVSGVFVPSSQGEYWALGRGERRRLSTLCAEQSAGRLRVYGHVGAPSTADALTLLDDLRGVPLTAVAALPPEDPDAGPRVLMRHFVTLAEASAFPLVLYSHPSLARVAIDPQVASELACHDNIVGLIDSASDMDLTRQYVGALADQGDVLIGRDACVLQGLQAGCAGSVGATAGLVPRLVLDVVQAFEAGEPSVAALRQRRLARFAEVFMLAPLPAPAKMAASLLGLPAGASRNDPADSHHRLSESVRAILADVGVLDVG